jgi:hypothetical protein
MGLCFGWVNLQRALVRNKSPRPLPQVDMGMNDHTKIPQLYQAENNLWLVDFPGGNSIEDYGNYWKHFSALPSFAVLLLPFEVHTTPPHHSTSRCKIYYV